MSIQGRDEPRRVIVAENPRAGASSQHELVVRLCELLERSGCQTEILTDPAEIQAAIDQAQMAGQLGCVVTAGGDGTLSMVAPWVAPQTPLAILPLGTENLLAQHLGFDRDVERTASWILEGGTQVLDAGRANGKLFLVMASVGFDAEVVSQVHAARTGHIDHWSYAGPILRSIRDYRYPPMRIFTDNHPKPVVARWAFVFNVPRYAMGLPIVADAIGDDGKLDLCSFRRGRFWRGLLYFIGIVLRTHRGWRDTHYERARWIRIESDESVNYQLDGDPGGQLPLLIEILPSRLTFVTPPSVSGGAVSRSESAASRTEASESQTLGAGMQ